MIWKMRKANSTNTHILYRHESYRLLHNLCIINRNPSELIEKVFFKAPKSRNRKTHTKKTIFINILISVHSPLIIVPNAHCEFQNKLFFKFKMEFDGKCLAKIVLIWICCIKALTTCHLINSNFN